MNIGHVLGNGLNTLRELASNLTLTSTLIRHVLLLNVYFIVEGLKVSTVQKELSRNPLREWLGEDGAQDHAVRLWLRETELVVLLTLRLLGPA